MNSKAQSGFYALRFAQNGNAAPCGEGDGTIWTNSASLPTVTDMNWAIVGTGDFNGDGKTDILWRHGITGQIAVWLMDGTIWSYNSAWLPSVPDANWIIGAP
jgi:hypothetical protein